MSQKNAPEAWFPVKNVCLKTDKESGVRMAEGPTQNFTEESKESMKKVTDMMSSKPTILLNSIMMVAVSCFNQEQNIKSRLNMPLSNSPIIYIIKPQAQTKASTQYCPQSQKPQNPGIQDRRRKITARKILPHEVESLSDITCSYTFNLQFFKSFYII